MRFQKLALLWMLEEIGTKTQAQKPGSPEAHGESP